MKWTGADFTVKSHSSGTFFWGLFFSLVLFACTETSEGIRPQYEKLVVSVYASVIVQPEGLYKVYPQNAGLIEQLMVVEGDTVKKGQVICRIKSSNQSLNVSSARENAALAEQNLTNRLNILEEEMEATRKQLQVDSLNYVRQQRLWTQNIGSKSELENKKLRYELTRDQLETQQKTFAQTKRELEHKLEQSRYALQQSLNTLHDFDIQSKIDGIVYRLFKEEGELIQPQEPLAEIGEGRFLLIMQIDELDIARVEVGQKAVITLDAYEGQTFYVRISRIFPSKKEQTQTFQVEAQFEAPPQALYDGLSGEANIIVRQKDLALTIPQEYLVDESKVITPNGEVPVTTGIRNINKIEIISGIDTTTVLLKP